VSRDRMEAMVLDGTGEPLRWRELEVPEPGVGELLVRVHACGVCRTDLHLVDGELPEPRRPVVPGHQIVGTVVRGAAAAGGPEPGDRVGVPWLGSTCGHCRHCRRGHENLCDAATFTGYTRDGGFAAYVVADSRYCFPLADGTPPAQTAPLLCAGLIGYRAYRMAGPEAETVGLYGFGAAAHIIAQVAVHDGRRVFAFTRPGDTAGQAFARDLGATWAGGSDVPPPEPLDAALIFAPVGRLVPTALRAVDRGGVVVCAGIHMSDIPAFPYRDLWQERSICSVANLTRADGEALLSLAPQIPLRRRVRTWPLRQANEALACLRDGRLKGAAVLEMDGGPA